MKQNFFNIAGKKLKSFWLFIFILIFIPAGKAQTLNNLEIFYLLVDSAAAQTAQSIFPFKQEVSITFELGNYYTIFQNRIVSQLTSNGLKVIRTSQDKPEIPILNFVIENAEVKYGKQERDGFFGDFFVERKLTLSGNYLLSNVVESSYKEFSYSFNDKIKVEDIEKLENRSFPFTSGILPPEPFFSSLLEPVVAIGAAAAAVILFFSVRSK